MGTNCTKNQHISRGAVRGKIKKHPAPQPNPCCSHCLCQQQCLLLLVLLLLFFLFFVSFCFNLIIHKVSPVLPGLNGILSPSEKNKIYTMDAHCQGYHLFFDRHFNFMQYLLLLVTRKILNLFFNLVEERFAKILAFLYIVVCLLSFIIMPY